MRCRFSKSARAVVVIAAIVTLAAACGDDSGKSSSNTTTAASGGSSGGGTTSSGGATTVASAKSSGLLSDNGPCKSDLPPYPVGMITVFETPVASAIDQVHALEASVKAFNARGGIGGHCMKVTACDDKADPNKAVDCARQLVSDGIVATLNDTESFNPAGVISIFEPAGLPRVVLLPAGPELASKISYPIGMGGTGTTFAMVPTCARAGFKKIAAIHFESPLVGPLFQALGPMLKAYGAQMVATIPVPAGTTDYQQFILKAQQAGAECVILALANSEAVQVLNAAKDLNTKLLFSGSLGTFGLKDLENYGKFGEQIYLNDDIPPVTNVADYPIYADVIKDLSASGDPQLQADTLRSQPVRSWIAVYLLKEIVEKFGTPDVISRDAITAAIKKAKDVNVFGLIPPWTPSDTSKIPSFAAVSNPWYNSVHYDDTKKAFVVQPDKLNMINEVTGQINYAQPGAATTPTTAATATTAAK